MDSQFPFATVLDFGGGRVVRHSHQCPLPFRFAKCCWDDCVGLLPIFYHLRDASVILWSIYVLSSLASMQRLKSFSPAALPADATKVTALKANTVPKGRTTTKKRRMHKQDGKSYALTIDLHTILRMSFTLVAIFCCVFAYRSLSSEVNKVVEIQESQPESIRRLPRNHNEDEQISSTLDLTKGKERILQLLKEAGIFDLDDDTLHRLPTWDEVM